MTPYDILIKNVTIVDGSGEPSYKGDIAIEGEKIAALGEIRGDAVKVIDGSGLIASPGFIDPHSHADMAILGRPTADNLVMQGITTFIGGNCGLSPAPVVDKDLMLKLYGGSESLLGYPIEWNSFAEWLDKVENTGSALNYIPMVGHHAIRIAVMGENVMRPASTAEIEEMMGVVNQAMQEGAWGFSTFRDPGPCEFATLEELVDLMRVVKQYDGFYMPHTYRIQSQWPTDDPKEVGYIVFHGPTEDVYVGRYRGYLEAIEVGRQTGARVHVAHLGTAYPIFQPHPAYLDEASARATLEIFDQARAAGVDVTYDTIAASSSISGQLPLLSAFARWVDADLEGEALKAWLISPAFRQAVKEAYAAGRLKFAMVHTRVDPYWFDNFLIVKHSNPAYAGKPLEEIVKESGKDPLDLVLDLLSEDPGATWVQFRDKRMNDEAIAVFIKHPLGMPCTDMIAVTSLDAADEPGTLGYGLSPIMFGLYAHYLGNFVRERGDFSLEWAVRQATSAPAERFGIEQRGRLQAGYYADIVLFDINTVAMQGDFHQPAQRPAGIQAVLVNGQVVYDGQNVTGALPGKVLRKSD